jgi:hypothetical protein
VLSGIVANFLKSCLLSQVPSPRVSNARVGRPSREPRRFCRRLASFAPQSYGRSLWQKPSGVVPKPLESDKRPNGRAHKPAGVPRLRSSSARKGGTSSSTWSVKVGLLPHPHSKEVRLATPLGVMQICSSRRRGCHGPQCAHGLHASGRCLPLDVERADCNFCRW